MRDKRYKPICKVCDETILNKLPFSEICKGCETPSRKIIMNIKTYLRLTVNPKYPDFDININISIRKKKDAKP